MKTFGFVVAITLFALGANSVGVSLQGAKEASKRQPTFGKDVAPILYRRCAPCHHPGEVAPFSLLTYDDARKWSKMIGVVVRDRVMPPWKAAPGDPSFAGERFLSEIERGTLLKWIGNGSPRGPATELPAVPKFSEGWQLGEPDLILEMPKAFTIPATGPDHLRNFVIPTNLDRDRTVGAIEFRPGNAKVVHHSLVFLDSNRYARSLQSKDNAPGYDSFGGPGFFPTGSLGGWAPGGSPHWLPDGVGRYFQKGSDVVLQIHYHPTGKPESDRSKIGIYFTRKPVTQLVGGIALENWDIAIPAGESQYRRTSSYVLPKDVTLLSVTPHMHLLGKEMRARAVLPDGTVKNLVHVQNWDFKWQDTFYFREPIRLPKGTQLDMESVHDNSKDNPVNPFNPPRLVRYGEGSNDEMSLCIFEVTTDRIGDLLELLHDDSVHRRIVERAIELTRKSKIH